MTRPNPHIALIYHYDLARALNGELVDWVAIPVNVDAGREGGDLCRAAADFAKRRDLFAMPAPTNPVAPVIADCPECDDSPSCGHSSVVVGRTASDSPVKAVEGDKGEGDGVYEIWICDRCDLVLRFREPQRWVEHDCIGDGTLPKKSWRLRKSAVPVGPNPVVEQQAADPEPSTASTAVPGTAVIDGLVDELIAGDVNGVFSDEPAIIDKPPAWDRELLRWRMVDLVDQGHETLLRRYWPEGVPTLKHDGHSDAQLQLILACVRRVEAEVGAGWHPDDGPPPHVNTNPRASVEYPVAAAPDEGGRADVDEIEAIGRLHIALNSRGFELCREIAREAHAAGRSLSVISYPTQRRYTIARAVIAWVASGRTVDELWIAATQIANVEHCWPPDATLGGLISQFTIEQADRLYEAASV